MGIAPLCVYEPALENKKALPAHNMACDLARKHAHKSFVMVPAGNPDYQMQMIASKGHLVDPHEVFCGNDPYQARNFVFIPRPQKGILSAGPRGSEHQVNRFAGAWRPRASPAPVQE